MLENIYITLAIIVALMFIDYILTVKGYMLYKQTHAQYVDVESYELNPLFKEHLKKKRYNIKHLLTVIIVCAFIYNVHYLSINNIFGLQTWAYPFFTGMLLSMFVYINARHIQNLIVYRAMRKDLTLLSGKIKQKPIYSLHVSSAHAFGVFCILLGLFIFTQTWFTLGFALGPLSIITKNASWIRRYRKMQRMHEHHSHHK